VRGWRILRATEARPPQRNPVSPRLHRKFLQRTKGENPYFGRLSIDGWSGHFLKGLKLARWWAPVSRLRISQEDWQREWPKLCERLERDDGNVLKRSAGGDVIATTLQLGGQEVEVIVKRPRRKTLWRRLNTFGRAGKARRSWFKAWKLAIRNFPVEWPLLLMERRTLGYVTESVLVVARVIGTTLMQCDFDLLTSDAREDLFRRLGRTIRRLEISGFCHFDSKTSNWIVIDDPSRGPVPVIIDVDGIRHYRWDGFGLNRLLRSLKEHPAFTPLDSKHVCLGYAPYAKVRE
jgi:tRNA A-37 threonylcarbamoyl transferase component Bud32